MAYIEPDSEITLFLKTGLSPDYQNTYRPTNRTEQENFFRQNFGYSTKTKMTYNRVGDNQVKIEAFQGDLRRADYMYIDNKRPGKTFNYYAFITESYYINEHTTLLTFEIDWIQTYFFEMFNLGFTEQMYIERETPDVDGMHLNTMPESVPLGDEYLYIDMGWDTFGTPGYNEGKDGSFTGTFTNWVPVIARPNPDPGYIQFISGMPSPIVLKAFEHYQSDAGSTSALYDYLKNLNAEDYQEIVDFFMYPKVLLSSSDKYQPTPTTETVGIPGRGYNPWKEDGFVPRNNKLYTSPYCYITVTNGCGQAVELSPQYFKSGIDEANFRIGGTFCTDPEFYCAPMNYGGSADWQPQYCVTLSGVPKIPIVTDAYKVYLSQTAASRATANLMQNINAWQGAGSTIFGGLLQGIGMSSGGVLGASAQGASSSLQKASSFGSSLGSNLRSSGQSQWQQAFSDRTNMLSQMADAKHMANSTSGGSAPNAMYIAGEFNFHCYIQKIPVEYAKAVDEYFTMYGYAVNRVKKPNIYSRQKWNYLKGRNYIFNQRVPTQAKLACEAALNRGITFWDLSAEMGDYSVANPRAT